MPSLLSPCLWPPLPRPTFFLPFFPFLQFVSFTTLHLLLKCKLQVISCSWERQTDFGNQSHGSCFVQGDRNSSHEIHCVTNGLFMTGHDLKRWATHIKQVNWRIIILLLSVTNGRQLPCESKLCRQQSQGCSVNVNHALRKFPSGKFGKNHLSCCTP